MDRDDLAGFAGAYRDCVTYAHPLGNGYRWYLPSLMRFNAPDSWSPFDAGGVHAYAYCAADPINRVDLSGHMWSDVLKDASETAGHIVHEAVEEPASSLATQASQRAAQRATEDAPSTSGGASRSNREGISLAVRRSKAVKPLNLQPSAFISPETSMPRTPALGEVEELMGGHRATAETIELNARGIRRRWRALRREANRETAALGRADVRASQLSRAVVGGLAGDADYLLASLTQLEQHLGQYPGQFEVARGEIRSLQERIGRVSAAAWDIYSELRQRVDTTRATVFEFDPNANAN